MKLVTFSAAGGAQRLGAIGSNGQSVVDLAIASAAYQASQAGGAVLPSKMNDFLATGAAGLALAKSVVSYASETGVGLAPLSAVKLHAPVPTPPKILCLAGNYQAHIQEGGGQAVDKNKILPKVFIKPVTTVVGPSHTLVLPASVSTTVDWEIELAAVIGKPAKYVSTADALSYVAGYTVFNDISSRSLELAKARTETGGFDEFFDWLNGKWQDGWGIMGPYLVTADEVGDPQNLQLRLYVNDTLHQNANSVDMIFNIAETISWCSKLVTLQPGDVIATGTPSGVGAATETYLKAGDVMRGEIDKLGAQVNAVVQGE